ncbi:MAG: hypothetical protein DI616_03835 [Paracoccus denitrificans]|uniref:Excalibur calcium-binding domain-containing protein n=1 Tax=Paracoccus denitrificans TaxID=266 RepID=A0A533IDP5_PARDE|nr:MAG: hypothetical protein DI616_03835 [Paracoccus denitrificans]
MRKVLLGLACVAGLSACADGTGQVLDPRYRFDADRPYDEYRAAREMALTGNGAIPQTVPKARPFAAPTPEEIASPVAYQRYWQQRAAATSGGAVPAGRGYYDPDTGRTLPSNTVPVSRSATAAPATVPPAHVNDSPDTDALSRYAGTQRHAPGTAAYNRSGGSDAVAARACARHPNADAAQLMFLSSGGPQQDPMGMDPDGDGYVCGWDPTHYRVDRL